MSRQGFWYRLLLGCTDVMGAWLLAVVARIIALFYFLFSPRVKESIRLYQTLFPGKSPLYYRWCTLRQYQNFTTIHLDRYLHLRKHAIRYTADGWDRLLERIDSGKGGILLMSHLGNWEIAASLLKQECRDLRLLLYMGAKQLEGVEKMQKEQLRDAGVTIIGVEPEEKSPLAAVEGIRCLREGGLVSMTGDILWRSDQRRIAVRFLNHEAYVSAAPFAFSLASGVPLYVFFAFRTGGNAYHLTLSEPISLPQTDRTHRDEVLAQAAQRYADLLEEALRNHPFEWYHFERFLQ